MKFNPNLTVQQNMVRLVNDKALFGFTDDALTFGNPTSVTPGPGNGNKNSQIVVQPAGVDGPQGSVTLNYNRNTLAALNPFLGTTIFIDGGLDTHAEIQDAICQRFGFLKSEVTFTNPASPPKGGQALTYGLSPVANSKLYIGTTFNVTVRNMDSAPAPVLLLRGDDAYAGSSDFRNEVTNTAFTKVGSPVISLDAKYGTGSISLAVTDYLRLAYGDLPNLLAGDLTIELWVKFPATSTRVLLSQYNGGTVPQRGFSLYTVDTNLRFDFGTYSMPAAAGLLANTWQHVAVSRAGNQLFMFINGVLRSTGVVAGDLSPVTWDLAVASDFVNGVSTTRLGGLIDDLAIYPYAKYQTAFVPKKIEV